MLDDWFTYSSDDDRSVESGETVLRECADVQLAIRLSRAFLQNSDTAFKLYSPVMRLLNPTITEEQMKAILEKVLRRGFDVVLEHADTMNGAYMICAPSTDLDSSRSKISFNIKYAIGQKDSKRAYLHFVKLLQAVGEALTPFIMKENHPKLQQLDDANNSLLEKMDIIQQKRRYMVDYGNVFEEDIFGGRVVAFNNTARWISSGPLIFQARKFKDLPLGRGNYMGYAINDSFIEAQLSEMVNWTTLETRSIKTLPSFLIPPAVLTIVEGNFKRTREEAETSLKLKRKTPMNSSRAASWVDQGDEASEFDEDCDEYQDLISKGLALSSAQYERRCREGAKY